MLTSENSRYAEQIEKLNKIGELMEEEWGENELIFEEPVSDAEIQTWEKENGIKIPESYKEWLRVSGESEILHYSFYSPKNFITDNNEKPYDMPDECVVIGDYNGLYRSLCFSSVTGEIMYINHEEVYIKTTDFGDILDDVIEMLEDRF